MALLAFILFLAIFGQYGNTCSILPGGTPPCFPNAVDYTKQVEKTKEIRYRLKKNEEFVYTSLVSENWPGKLGEPWVEEFGTADDVVVCEPDVSSGSYLLEYETKMQQPERLSREKKDMEKFVFKNADVNKEFVITKREVWNCVKKEQDKLTPNLSFRRVVTELLSKLSLKELIFYDGINVNFVPLPYDPEEANGTERTLIVREVKYLHPESNNVLKYEGFLEFQSENIKMEDLSLFTLITGGSDRKFKLSDYRIHWAHTADQRETEETRLRISEYGERCSENRFKSEFEANEEYLEHHPLDKDGCKDVAVCKMDLNDPELYKLKYLTEWSEIVSTHGNDNGYGHKAIPLEKKIFYFKFITTKHELWSCKTKKGGKIFVKSLLEYVATDYINSIQIKKKDKIDLWKFQLNLKDPYQSVGVREVSFFNAKNEFIRYEGSIEESKHLLDKIFEPVVIEKKPVPMKVKRMQQALISMKDL